MCKAADPELSFDSRDIWKTLNTMKLLIIIVLELKPAVDEYVNRYTLTIGDICQYAYRYM